MKAPLILPALVIAAALAGCAELPAILQPPVDQVDSVIREEIGRASCRERV